MSKGPGIRFGIRWDDGRRPKRAILAVALAALLVPAAVADARPTPPRTQVLVVGQHGKVGAAKRLTERLGGTVGHDLEIVDGFTASVPRRAVKRLAASRAVRAVSRDGSLSVSSTDPDEVAAASTKVVKSATGAKGSAFDGAGVGVALLDSGAVELGGLQRPGTLVNGPDFSEEGDDPDLAGLDTFGHGSHLAGLIAGHDPLTGFDGVAPGARVISVKVAGADGTTSLARVLAGMEWIRANSKRLDIRVLNLSLGTDEGRDYRRELIAWAAERLWREGIAVVASAGNRGRDAQGLDLPAADPYVIAVGATDTADTPDPADDHVADFSSRSAVRAPDVLAPGTGIVSLRVPGSTLDEEFPGARIGDDYFRGSGTSQAAAIVSGIAARLLQQRPGLDNDQLKALLIAGAVDVPGGRRVDFEGSADADPLPPGQAKQRFPEALPELHNHGRRGGDALLGAGDAELWNGRRWSGMKWSGRRWSGMKWNGMKWLGDAWDAAADG